MKNIILSLAIVIGLSSCDSMINLKPETDVTFTNFFQDESNIESIAMEFFAQGRTVYSVIGYHNYMDMPIDFNGAMSFIYPFVSVRNLTSAHLNDQNLNNSWSMNYNIIYNCNLLLENLYRIKNISEERANFWRGEAYFYKAAAYYKIACDWGAAPIIPKSTDPQVIGRSSTNEVLQEAIDNAKKAFELLPLFDQISDAAGVKVASKQWGSKGTTAALLAYIYAWRGALNKDAKDFEASNYYSTLLINNKVGTYTLTRNAEEVCTDALVKYGKESIWEMDINYQEVYESTAYHEAYFYVGYPWVPGIGVGTTVGGFKLRGLGVTAQRIKEMYEAQDQRRESYFYKLDSLSQESLLGTTQGKAYMNKWRKVMTKIVAGNPQPAFVNIDQNRIIYRLADVILLRAECYARLNKADSAAMDLNTIRKRVNATLYPQSGESDLRMAIFREREKELFLEGHRYNDIVRNGYWKTELTPAHSKLTEEDVQRGALYLPVFVGAFEGNNDLMTQTPFWLNRK